MRGVAAVRAGIEVPNVLLLISNIDNESARAHISLTLIFVKLFLDRSAVARLRARFSAHVFAHVSAPEPWRASEPVSTFSFLFYFFVRRNFRLCFARILLL